MKKLLACVLICGLFFTTCTGCAGIALRSDGTIVSYAIGKSRATIQRTDAESACDYSGDYVPAMGQWKRLSYRSAAGNPPTYCVVKGPEMLVQVEGGNLGAGWFSAITALALIFGGAP